MKNRYLSIMITLFIILNIVLSIFAISNNQQESLSFNGQRIYETSKNTFTNESTLIKIKINFMVEEIDVVNDKVLVMYHENEQIVNVSLNYSIYTYAYEDFINLQVDDNHIKYAKLFNDLNEYYFLIDEFPEILIFSFIGLINIAFGTLLIINIYQFIDKRFNIFTFVNILLSLPVTILMFFLLIKNIF